MNINERILELLYKKQATSLEQITSELHEDVGYVEIALDALIASGCVVLDTPPEQYRYTTWYRLEDKYFMSKYDADLASQQQWEEVYHNAN